MLPLWRQVLARWKTLEPDRYVDWLERAAIAEFDGGLEREAAEKFAWDCAAGEVHR